MTTSTLKVKNGTIRLPKELQKAWKNAEVYIRVSEDTAILKRIYQPGKIFDEDTAAKLKKAGRQITDRDIEEAVKWA